MEGRIRSLLLGCIYTCLALASLNAQAELDIEQVSKPVIQPNIERMEFDEAKLNPNNFEIIASFGILSIEDFGVNSILGAKLAYRVSENFFVDLEIGSSTAGETTYDALNAGGLPLISADESKYSYYLVNIGYDIFPGESFVTANTTLNTAFYVVAGAGNTEFGGFDNFTFSWGAGYRVIVNNYLSSYLDIRNHTFNRDIYGEDKQTNNIEITLGVGFYF